MNYRRWVVRGLSLLTLSGEVAASSGSSGIGDSITYFTNGLITLGSVLFVLAIVWGGFKMMTSGGDPKLYSEGKNVLKNAVLGYLLIVIASLIPRFVQAIAGGEIYPLVLIPPHGGSP